MAEDAPGELRRMAEAEAAKRRERQEKKIQTELVKTIKNYNLKINRLAAEIKTLWEKEQKLFSEGKTLRAKLVRWRREGKQRKLSELKKITPLIKSR